MACIELDESVHTLHRFPLGSVPILWTRVSVSVLVSDSVNAPLLCGHVHSHRFSTENANA